MSKIAIIGAGKTGRGFVGRLVSEENETIVFVDKNEQLVKKLNSEKRFNVSFFGNSRDSVVISDYTAHTWDSVDLSDTELIFVSVGGQNLSEVGECLRSRLKKDKKYYIITCENASKPAERLKSVIASDNVFVSESTVFCTTIENGVLDISSENYPYLQFDKKLLCGYIPEIKAVKPIDDFGSFLTRKLYTYNAASCVISYLGAQKGYSDYGEAANDSEILSLLDENYALTNKVLCKTFGYGEADQREFAELSRRKFCDRTIVDTIARNARDPQRKLGADERIIGPMKLILSNGFYPSVLIKTAAAALLYDDDGEWTKLKAKSSPEELLSTLCGLEKDSVLYRDILAEYYAKSSS